MRVDLVVFKLEPKVKAFCFIQFDSLGSFGSALDELNAVVK